MSIKQYDAPLNTDKNNSDWKIFQYIRPKSVILEFGPAYGRMTKYMKETLDCEVYIVEIDTEAYQEAIKYAQGGVCGNILNFLWLKKFKGILFDYIIFADVLEHLLNPLEALEKSISLLKEDGSILVSVPNMAHSSIIINLIKNKLEYRKSGLLDETHIRFFTYSSLIEMLESCSLIPIIEDGVITAPENTEFKNSYKEFINTEVIENREFANVYQFVFKCIKKDYYFKNKDNNSIHKIYDDKTTPSSVVFLDKGSGFTSKYYLIIPLNKIGNRFEIDVNLKINVKGIRFDPYEGYACIISDLQIITDNGVEEYTYINGININNVIVFNTIDPQIAIDFKGKAVSKVKISGNIYRYNFEDISLLSRCKWIFEQYFKIEDVNKIIIAERNSLVTERDELITIRNNLLEEKNNLINERDNLITERNGLINSRSWRFTKPLRNLASFVRRHKVLRLFAKGLLSIKRVGFKKTLQKINNYEQNYSPNNFIRLSDQEKLYQKKKVFQKQIKISIITPLYNTPELFLHEMVNSILAQTYSNWELCLADGSDKKHAYVNKICRYYIKKNKRIKYFKLKNNEGIAENTIQAFNLSNGDYILLLDHDDILAENALFEVVKAINNNENVDFIFSDRLVFDDKTKKIIGRQHLPGYNPDLLRSFNYASHLNVFSRYIIDKVGFERSGYNGSQDYEFELRVIEAARKIVHIREILYYCRASEGSVASNPGSKLYAYENGRKALEEHITRIGYPGKVEFIEKTFSYRIHYNISTDEKVSIIIPNKDNVDLITKCIDSILSKTTYNNYEINIIENNSTLHETFTYYENLKKIHKDKIFIKNIGKTEEFNFSFLNNWAVRKTTGKYLLFLNNDTQIITPKWIEEMIMFAQRDDVGVVGVKLYYPDNTIQHSGLIVGLGGHCASHYDNKAPKDSFGYMHCLSMVRNYSAVTAACMMIKRNDFIDVDGFDEKLFKIGLNDIDICLKLREKNKLVIFTPYAELYHFEGASRGRDSEDASLNQRFLTESNNFKEKWHKYFENGDPYFYKNEY